MGKLFLAVAAVASLSFPNAGHERMTQAEIVITPSPLVGGSKARIKYTGKLPATITLDWHPAGSPASVTIPANPGYVDIEVPTEATSLIAIDDSGEAEAVGSMVQQP
jgi:hypothetical protein